MTGGASCSIVGCINKYTKGGISLHRFISQYVFHKTFNAIFVGISPTYPKDYWKVNWEWWCCCFLAQSAAAVSGVIWVIWIFPPYSMNALPSMPCPEVHQSHKSSCPRKCVLCPRGQRGSIVSSKRRLIFAERNLGWNKYNLRCRRKWRRWDTHSSTSYRPRLQSRLIWFFDI